MVLRINNHMYDNKFNFGDPNNDYIGQKETDKAKDYSENPTFSQSNKQIKAVFTLEDVKKVIPKECFFTQRLSSMKRAQDVVKEKDLFKKPHFQEDIEEIAALKQYMVTNGRPVRISNQLHSLENNLFKGHEYAHFLPFNMSVEDVFKLNDKI